MKKIITLALALVLVLSVAATAFAFGWDQEPETTPETLKDIKVEVIGLTDGKASSTFFGGTSTTEGKVALAEAYPVVAGTAVEFGVTITLGKDLFDDPNFVTDADIKLTAGNLTIDAVQNVTGTNTILFDKGVATIDLAAATVTQFVADNTDDTKVTSYVAKFIVKATAEKDEKDASFKVEAIIPGDKWDGDLFTFNKGDAKVEYDATGKSFDVYPDLLNAKGDAASENAGNYLTIFVDDEGKVRADKYLEVTVATVGTYEIVVNALTGEFNFWNAGIAETDATDIKALEAARKAAFDVLGFTYGAPKYFTKDLVEKNLGAATATNVTATYTFPAGVITPVVVAPVEPNEPVVEPNEPVVEPNEPTLPDTGDATTVIGFVMIVMAMAAAFVAKKVRA